MNRLISALALFITLPFTAHGIDTLVLTTAEWPPYIGQDLPQNGFAAEVVREALARAGFRADFRFFPWARTVQMSDSGDVDGYFPEYWAKEREEYALFSDPFEGGPVVFLKLKGRPIIYRKLEDLKPYTIGVVRGYVNEKKFDEATFLNKVEAVDDATNIRALMVGRLDLVVIDQYVGDYLVRTIAAELGGGKQVETVGPALKNQSLYFCLSRKNPKAGEEMRKFNEGLRSLIADGTYARILARFRRG